jgi:hypothetical protein
MEAVTEVPQFVAGDEGMDDDSNGSCSSLSSKALHEKVRCLMMMTDDEWHGLPMRQA